jgi:hypothetical protein
VVVAAVVVVVVVVLAAVVAVVEVLAEVGRFCYFIPDHWIIFCDKKKHPV